MGTLPDCTDVQEVVIANESGMAAHIITYGSMATKNSIKDVARVEKLPLDKANALCKAIPVFKQETAYEIGQ